MSFEKSQEFQVTKLSLPSSWFTTTRKVLLALNHKNNKKYNDGRRDESSTWEQEKANSIVDKEWRWKETEADKCQKDWSSS